VKWLWPGRIPLGKLSIIAGGLGLGKSYLTLGLSARISLGAAWPDQGVAPQGKVLIISAEDGLEDTIRPKLELLEADLDHIHAICTIVRQEDQEVAFSLVEHLSQLEQATVQHSAVLLVLAPILAFTGKKWYYPSH
jgi:RecA-family ATPase